MFSGIISNRGVVLKKNFRGGQIRFAFRLLRREADLELGESIAVDGVCLSVAGKKSESFEADAVHETLKATTLGELKAGDRVNLERSLKTGDRVGGHFVTGHVDGRGILRKIKKNRSNILFEIEAPKPLLAFIAAKGSIAVDGVGLTVQSQKGNHFSVALIPHTLRATTLGMKKTGDVLNLEADLIARYLFRMRQHLRSGHSKNLSAQLKRQGF